jgi:hypothetical protein
VTHIFKIVCCIFPCKINEKESAKFKKPKRIHYLSFGEEGETQIDTGLRMYGEKEDRVER